jgi:hypothetical protein
MTFYHGTTILNLRKIQAEGLLWGIRSRLPGANRDPDRATWLAVVARDAEVWSHVEVVLEVVYESGRSDSLGRLDSYHEGDWQFITYEPIPIDNIASIRYLTGRLYI